MLLLCGVLSSCGGGQKLEIKDGFAVVTPVKANEAQATFAGGCFWAMQECMVELEGVNKVISGYAGGRTNNPSYDQVLSKTTGHAESVLIYYDPAVISFEQLVGAFFNAHDPTQVDRQGPDVGSDYRSIAFYRSVGEEQVIRKLISAVNNSEAYQHPVATEIVSFEKFYPAEAEHQDYYRRNEWDFYIKNISKPKVMKMRKAVPELLKSEYKD